MSNKLSGRATERKQVGRGKPGVRGETRPGFRAKATGMAARGQQLTQGGAAGVPKKWVYGTLGAILALALLVGAFSMWVIMRKHS